MTRQQLITLLDQAIAHAKKLNSLLDDNQKMLSKHDAERQENKQPAFA